MRAIGSPLGSPSLRNTQKGKHDYHGCQNFFLGQRETLLNLNASSQVGDTDKLFTLAYAELRRLAAMVKRSGGGQTLNPTALVNEAWIKMASSPSGEFQDMLHFKRVAARAMRQILVDAARRKSAYKRGGEDAPFQVTFNEELGRSASSPTGMIALNEALDELALKSPRQAEVAVLRIFQDMEMIEIAAALKISEVTVHRDWKVIRAWLSVQLLPAAHATQTKR
jgi:RNA polymerase sigma factor (TIGR02999 family)